MCLDLPKERPDELHALAFAPQIEECFGRESLLDVVRALEGGGSEWHRQVLERSMAEHSIA